MTDKLRNSILSIAARVNAAARRQTSAGHADIGRRSGITAGQHLDQILSVIVDDMIVGGYDLDSVFVRGSQINLPGWFRRSKRWDITAYDRGRLVCTIELKSISSSFGNNLNNRVEEALGTAFDTSTAISKHLFHNGAIPPLLGYVLIAGDCVLSSRPVDDSSRTFLPVDPIFGDTSYLQRMQILCERLREQNVYQAVWYVEADYENGIVSEPSPDLTYEKFIRSLINALEIIRA